jgi:signal transduction histidine kinase
VNLEVLKHQLEESQQKNEKLLMEAAILREKTKRIIHSLIERHEEDRRAISRELHDQIAQVLAGINFELSVLMKEASRGDQRLQEKIVSTQSLITDSIEVIHSFARQLRPITLDELGIVDAIQQAIKDFVKISKIPVELKLSDKYIELNSEIKTVIFRVVQEALMNISKHSKAKNVKIILEFLESMIKLEISDDGESFNKDSAQFKKNNRGVGIQGMKDRVDMVDGTFEIVSKPGSGTQIIVVVPMLVDDEDGK